MKKTNIIKLQTMILVFLTLVSLASASESFSAYSQYKEIDLCACSSYDYTISIENHNPMVQGVTYIIEEDGKEISSLTGMVSNYHIFPDGSASSFVSYAPSSFSLASGSSQKIFAFLNIPCGTEGKFDLDTVISTDLGLEKVISQKINIMQCDNIGIDPATINIESCSYDPVEFKLNVTNTAPFHESYEISVDKKFAPYTSASETSFAMGPGGSKEISLTTDLGSSQAFFGDNEFNIRITAKNNGIYKEIPVQYTVKDCYDYNVSLGYAIFPESKDAQQGDDVSGTYVICDNTYGKIPVTITNIADSSNSFFLELQDALPYISLDVNTIENLSSKASYTAYILLRPFAYLEENLTFRLAVRPGLGMAEKSFDIPLKIKRCYSPELSVPGTIKIISNVTENTFTIGNIGDRTAGYDIALYGLEWAEAYPEHLELKPGQQENITLVTYPDISVEDGIYSSVLVVKAGASEYRKDITFRLHNPNFVERSFYNIKASVIDYWVYIIIALIILLVLILLIPKISRRMAEVSKRNFRIYDYKDSTGVLKKKVSAAPEPKPGSKKRSRLLWLWILLLILMLAVSVPLAFWIYKDYAGSSGTGGFTEKMFNRSSELFSYTAQNSASYLKESFLSIKSFFSGSYTMTVSGMSTFWSVIRSFFLHFWIYILIAFVSLASLIIIVWALRHLMISRKRSKRRSKHKTDSAFNYKRWIPVIILLILLLFLGFSYRSQIKNCFLPTINEAGTNASVISKPSIPNASTIPSETIDETKEGKSISYLDKILSAIDPDRYTYDINGDVYDSYNKNKLSNSQLAVLISKHKLEILNKTALSEPILDSLVYTLLRTQTTDQDTILSEDDKGDASENLSAVVEVKCDIDIAQDSERDIDLDLMFSDPDKDILSYSSSQPDGISVSITDGVARLVPDENFVGVSKIVFTADDTKGGVTSSPELNICVKAGSKDIKSISKYYTSIRNFVVDYINYILAGIIILVILIFLINYFKPYEDDIKHDGSARGSKKNISEKAGKNNKTKTKNGKTKIKK